LTDRQVAWQLCWNGLLYPLQESMPSCSSQKISLSSNVAYPEKMTSKPRSYTVVLKVRQKHLDWWEWILYKSALHKGT
jgi:hypothetical protein